MGDRLRDGRDHRYARLELREPAGEASLAPTAEDACYGREGPVASLVGGHEGRHDRRRRLPLEALSSTSPAIGKGREGSLYVSPLEDCLAIDGEAPAVGREDEPCGVVVGSVDSEGGITSQTAQIERMEAGIVQQATRLGYRQRREGKKPSK